MAVQAYLVMAGPPEAVWAYPVGEESVLIGREKGCHVRLVHPMVSGRHCELWSEKKKLWVRDLKSTQGTYVNGSRIQQRHLAFGDLLQVGPLVAHVVRSLAEGEKVFGGGMEEDVPGAGAPSPPLLLLSPVEHEIVRLLVEGHSEKEVGTCLHLGQHSVHSHVKRIYQRLGISSRAELVSWYLRGVPSQQS
jgi:DNA-binding CsgD family transcriptional regulator